MHILNMQELVGFTKRQIVLAYRELAQAYMSAVVVCDVCGAPSTHQAVDMAEVSESHEDRNRYERTGPVKKGCSDHRVESVMRKKS